MIYYIIEASPHELVQVVINDRGIPMELSQICMVFDSTLRCGGGVSINLNGFDLDIFLIFYNTYDV